ncbi:hypothetical protein [Polaribacter tangerinus]|uniref:hypothetical protein n=1 Tax=Polaribacter tangerinus TaxID=1920034 RepID=UPI000B4BBB83|nr:hypothetical protein [Polaribacter tangerinus]
MQIQKKDTHILVIANENSFVDFKSNFDAKFKEFKESNLIVQFSEHINIKTKDFLVFLEIAKKHTLTKLSFVVVCKTANVDELPEELNVVPTLQEAEDILEMEAIERELGF